MSKAFTKEDDEAGFAQPASAVSVAIARPFRITATGHRRARAQGETVALAHAELLPPVASPHAPRSA